MQCIKPNVSLTIRGGAICDVFSDHWVQRVIGIGQTDLLAAIDVLEPRESGMSDQAKDTASLSSTQALRRVQTFCERVCQVATVPAVSAGRAIAALCASSKCRPATISSAHIVLASLAGKLAHVRYGAAGGSRQDRVLNAFASVALAHPSLLLAVQPAAMYEDSVDTRTTKGVILADGYDAVECEPSSGEACGSEDGSGCTSGDSDSDDCTDSDDEDSNVSFHGPRLAIQMCQAVQRGFSLAATSWPAPAPAAR